MKTKLFYLLLLFASLQFTAIAQSKKSTSENKQVDNIYMTWNKNTPESEMKDDIKALADHGVTVTYSDVKRNGDGEITAIKVNYSDKNGATGSMALNGQKPINIIKIYKQNDEIGFGEPSDSGFAFANGFNADDIMKDFQFNEKGMPGQSFNFQFPNDGSSSKSSSRTIIKKDGKKPLILEDGNVIEGGEDYTLAEIEEIKKNNQPNIFDKMDFEGFDSKDYFIDLQKMKDKIDELSKQSLSESESYTKSDLEKEIEKAKEEKRNAKKEMENAKKELQKAKSTLKTQKI